MKKMICLLTFLSITTPVLACSLDMVSINNDVKKAVTRLYKLSATTEVRIVEDIDAEGYNGGDLALVEDVIWDETYGRNSDPGASCPDKVIKFSKVLVYKGEETCEGLIKTFPLSNKKAKLVFKGCHKE